MGMEIKEKWDAEQNEAQEGGEVWRSDERKKKGMAGETERDKG